MHSVSDLRGHPKDIYAHSISGITHGGHWIGRCRLLLPYLAGRQAHNLPRTFVNCEPHWLPRPVNHGVPIRPECAPVFAQTRVALLGSVYAADAVLQCISCFLRGEMKPMASQLSSTTAFGLSIAT